MRKICLVAVDVRSAHNVGSFFRTCDGFGAELVLVGITPRPKGNDDDRLPHIADKAHKEIAKTALGAEATVPWHYFKTFDEARRHLKSAGYYVAAIEQAPTSKDITDLPEDSDIALVVGTEVEGLDPETLKSCDGVYEIPMQGRKESFNVSVAAAVGLYELAKR